MRITDLTEAARPTVFYRGSNPGDTRRISTGDKFWDSLFFITSRPEMAKMYGETVETFVARPGAKIAYEGTRPFIQLRKGLGGDMSMLEWASTIAKRAKEAGYDAVWFQRQGDIGTAVINPNAFKKV